MYFPVLIFERLMRIADLGYDLQVGRHGGMEATRKSLEFHQTPYY